MWEYAWIGDMRRHRRQPPATKHSPGKPDSVPLLTAQRGLRKNAGPARSDNPIDAPKAPTGKNQRR
jgi:hypothetical protein